MYFRLNSQCDLLPFSPNQIGSAIVQVLSDPMLKQDLEVRARNRADQLESWDQRSRTVADFLSDLAAKN